MPGMVKEVNPHLRVDARKPPNVHAQRYNPIRLTDL